MANLSQSKGEIFIFCNLNPAFQKSNLRNPNGLNLAGVKEAGLFILWRTQ